MKKTTRSKKTTVKQKKQPKLKIVKETKTPDHKMGVKPFARFIKYDHHVNPYNLYTHNNIRARRRIA